MSKPTCGDCTWLDHCIQHFDVEARSEACDEFDDKRESNMDLVLDTQASFDVMAEIERAIKADFDITAISQIDDRDFPLAKNVVEFCLSPSFSGATPFPRQLQIALNAFGDWCPNCSDTLMATNPPVDIKLDDMLDRIQLLEYGVCPRCHKTRVDFVRSHQLFDYYEIDACLGQRCVIGSTNICLPLIGRVSIEEVLTCFKRMGYVFGYGWNKIPPLELGDGRGNFHIANAIFVGRPESILKIGFANGLELCGTWDHPIWLGDALGFVHLRDLKIGQVVPVFDLPEKSTEIVSMEYGSVQITYDFHIPEFHCFETNHILSHNSGKSFLTSLLSTYNTHRYLKLAPTPNKFFGLGAATTLHMTFVALSYGQAEKTLWEPYKGFMSENQWFREYHQMLIDKGNALGYPLFQDRATFFYYAHKKIAGAPSGPDKRSLRGLTRYGYSIDEVGWFETDQKSVSIKFNADEINQSLTNSMDTVRVSSRALRAKGIVDIPQAMGFLISSPSHVRDKIMRSVREADFDKTKYAVHYPTWECNPNFPESYFDARMKSDPIKTKRDFGAVPPLSENPFIEDWKALSRSSNPQISMTWAELSNQHHTDEWQTLTQYTKLELCQRDQITPRIMAIDAGYNNNAFAVVIGHMEPGKTVDEPNLVLDLVHEVRPGQNHIPINFPLMADSFLYRMADFLNLKWVLLDRWNSIDIMQRFRQRGAKAEQYSVNWNDWWTLRNAISAGRLVFAPTEVDFEQILNPKEDYEIFVKNRPLSHLMMQLLTVQQSGKQILKGPGLDDDIARCLCLMSAYAFHPPYSKQLVSHSGNRMEKLQRAVGLVSMKSRQNSVLPAPLIQKNNFPNNADVTGTLQRSYHGPFMRTPRKIAGPK